MDVSEAYYYYYYYFLANKTQFNPPCISYKMMNGRHKC